MAPLGQKLLTASCLSVALLATAHFPTHEVAHSNPSIDCNAAVGVDEGCNVMQSEISLLQVGSHMKRMAAHRHADIPRFLGLFNRHAALPDAASVLNDMMSGVLNFRLPAIQPLILYPEGPLGTDANLVHRSQSLVNSSKTSPEGCCPHPNMVVCKHGDDFTSPLPDVVTRLEKEHGSGEHLVDGFCYFDWDLPCTTARRNRNYLDFAMPIAALVNMVGPMMSSYKDPSGWETLHGTYGSDAKYCHDIGALDLEDPEHLLQNYSALEEVDKRMCANLTAQYGNMSMEQYSDTWKAELTSFVSEYHLPFSQRSKQSHYGIEAHRRLAAGTCNMGGLGCNLAYCMYTFCKLPNSKVGMGKQCRSNYMTESWASVST